MAEFYGLWGMLAFIFGWHSLKAFRKGNIKLPHCFPPLAGLWFLWEWGAFYWRYGGGYRLTFLCFVFLAVSPLLGRFSRWREYRRFRFFVRLVITLCFAWLIHRLLVVFAGLSPLWSGFWGLMFCGMALFPYQKCAAHFQASSRERASKRQRALERRKAALEREAAFQQELEKLDVLLNHELVSEAKTFLGRLIGKYPEKSDELANLRQDILSWETRIMQREAAEEYGSST